MDQPPKGGLVRGYDKPIHGSCAIYFPGGITIIEWTIDEFQTSNFQPNVCPIKLQLGF